MRKYARLTLERRQVIENMSAGGHTQADIGLAIGADQSTVSRELRRAGTVVYRAGRTHALAGRLAQVPTVVPLLDRCADLVGHLSGYLKARYSIAQALVLIARKYKDLPSISAQAVYDWLYSSDTPIKKALRKLMIRPRSRRRSRAKNASNKGKIGLL